MSPHGASRAEGFRVQARTGDYESVIGLEIHAQVLTRTKIFCGCPTTYGLPPNAAVCDVCLGLPGALPALNGAAVDLAVKAAVALGCAVHEWSQFARKHYFYPDLPKGYQITQYDRPLATGGRLPAGIAGPGYPVEITRLHLEEDAGKSVHDTGAGGTTSGIDFNRAGVPLIEIVTAPVLLAPADAAAFFRRLRELLVAIGVTDGNLEQGSLRCDANVSIRRRGETALGTRTEVKNLNSFRFLQKALEFEIARQVAAATEEVPIESETRLWDGTRTVAMRGKEAADDYRYFPEPDLPPLWVATERVAALAASLPERPDDRRGRLVREDGLSEGDAVLFTLGYPGLDRYWEEVARVSGDRRVAANWVRGAVVAAMKALGHAGIGEFAAVVPPGDLGRLLRLQAGGTLSGPMARAVFDDLIQTGRRLDQVLRTVRTGTIDEAADLEALVRRMLADHPGPVAEYRAGKTRVFGFLVGQVIKASAGRADARQVNDLVRRALDGNP